MTTLNLTAKTTVTIKFCSTGSEGMQCYGYAEYSNTKILSLHSPKENEATANVVDYHSSYNRRQLHKQ